MDVKAQKKKIYRKKIIIWEAIFWTVPIGPTDSLTWLRHWVHHQVTENIVVHPKNWSLTSGVDCWINADWNFCAQGLKLNWEKRNREFLVLPVCLDTIGQIKRKENLERTLNKLEERIRLLEANLTIYVRQ